MIVCVCNAICEDRLRAAARICKGSAEDVYDTLGFRPQCRQCLEEAEHLLDEERCCAA